MREEESTARTAGSAAGEVEIGECEDGAPGQIGHHSSTTTEETAAVDEGDAG